MRHGFPHHHLQLTAADGTTTVVEFASAILAVGSDPVTLPFIPPDDSRVRDSTGALELTDVPERLLIVGGGIIGLAMAPCMPNSAPGSPSAS